MDPRSYGAGDGSGERLARTPRETCAIIPAGRARHPHRRRSVHERQALAGNSPRGGMDARSPPARVHLRVRRGEGAKPAQAPPPPTVIVAEVAQRTVHIFREYVARTEAVPTVEIRARVSGVLEQVLFKEGSEVKQGQVLFVIQQDEYKAALQSARAQLAKAQADLTRAQDTSVVDRARAPARSGEGRSREESQQDVSALPSARQGPGDPAAGPGHRRLAREGRRRPAWRPPRPRSRTPMLAQRTPDPARRGRRRVGQGRRDPGRAEPQVHRGRSLPIDRIISKLAVDRGNLVGKGEPTLLATVSAVRSDLRRISPSRRRTTCSWSSGCPAWAAGEVPRDRRPRSS